MQVLQEARLVNRHQRTQTHRDGRKLPEIGHQLGMRIARQALAINLLAEVEQLGLADAAFHESTGIDAGRRVALDVEQVAAVVWRCGVPEMVEAGAEHRRHRRKGRDVSTQIAAIGGVEPVRLDHQRHRVPAHVGTQALLDFQVTRAALFLVGRDGVDVGRVGRKRPVDAGLPGLVDQLLEQEVRALRSLIGDDGIQCLQPFAGFLGIGVVGGGALKGLRHCRHRLSPRSGSLWW